MRKDILLLGCKACHDSWTCHTAFVATEGTRCTLCRCGGPAVVLGSGATPAEARCAGEAALAALRTPHGPV